MQRIYYCYNIELLGKLNFGLATSLKPFILWAVKTTFQEIFKSLRKRNFPVVNTKRNLRTDKSYSGTSAPLHLFFFYINMYMIQTVLQIKLKQNYRY